MLNNINSNNNSKLCSLLTLAPSNNNSKKHTDLHNNCMVNCSKHFCIEIATLKASGWMEWMIMLWYCLSATRAILMAQWNKMENSIAHHIFEPCFGSINELQFWKLLEYFGVLFQCLCLSFSFLFVFIGCKLFLNTKSL